MQAISLQKIFAFVFCFVICVSSIYAQNNLRALKFDEFDDSDTNHFYSYYQIKELSFDQRIERFTQQMTKKRDITAYVIYYKARINSNDVERRFISKVNGIKSSIQFNDQVKSKEIIIVDGGYRDKNTVELWIVPKDALLPEPTPIFNKSETFVCPNPIAYGNFSFNEPDTVDFEVSTYEISGVDDYSLKWRVSGGKIIRGQGTTKIKVKLNDSSIKRITAFVEFDGFPYPCPKVFSATKEISGKLYLIDSIGVASNGEMRARLDYFASRLYDNQVAKGHIIIYGSRSEGNKDTARIETLIMNHFAFRNIDVSRISITRGGYRETVASEMWLSLDLTREPIPTPTVDEKFVAIPRPVRKSRPRQK